MSSYQKRHQHLTPDSDDPEAKQIVSTLATDMGFHPVDIGPLKATRELEQLVA